MLAYITTMMVVLLCFAGLVLDSGLADLRYRLAQNTADAASLGAAEAIALGASESSATSTAQTVASQNGFSASALTLTYLDSSGGQTSSSSQVSTVKAAVQQTFPTTYMRFLGHDSVTVNTTASAAVAENLPCDLCLLSPSAAPALGAVGNGSIKVDNGGIDINSSASDAADLVGNGSITATSIGIVGDGEKTGNGTYSPTPTHISSVPDPLASVPEPSPGQLSNGSVNWTNGTKTINAGVYTNISVTGNGTLYLNPGLYIITGGVSYTGNGKIVGSGVTLYFTCGMTTSAACATGQAGAGLSLTGNGSYQLTAPTSGTYQGISIFYDRKNTATLSLTGNGSDILTGTIYAKSGSATLTGNGSVFQMNSLFVVDHANLTGNGSIELAYTHDANYPYAGLPGISQ